MPNPAVLHALLLLVPPWLSKPSLELACSHWFLRNLIPTKFSSPFLFLFLNQNLPAFSCICSRTLNQNWNILLLKVCHPPTLSTDCSSPGLFFSAHMLFPSTCPSPSFVVLLQPTLQCNLGWEVLHGEFLLRHLLSSLVTANERKYKGNHDMSTLTFDIEISATIIAGTLEHVKKELLLKDLPQATLSRNAEFIFNSPNSCLPKGDWIIVTVGRVCGEESWWKKAQRL